jgi:transcriptional regulator with XRE-family HTH domain
MTPSEIRQARKSLGLTQAAFAAVIGYQDKTAVSAIEAGARNPSPQVILLIRAYLAGYRPPDWPAP